MIEAILLAQLVCVPPSMPRQYIEATLWELHRETVVATGPTGEGGLIAVYAKEDRSTWTMLILSSGGCAWFVGAGENWQELSWIAPGDPA